MSETVKYKRPIAAGFAIMLGLATLAGCSGDKPSNNSECVGVEFADAKGGPGLIGVRVYPILKNNQVANEVSGKVVSGNDAGAEIKDDAAVFAGAGEFFFSYDTSATTDQVSTVDVFAEVAGHAQIQACPETVMHFNPQTSALTPAHQ